LTADAVHRLELRVHPLVLALMGNSEPRTGLEAKLSVHHCAAAALRYGQVGVREFTEACVSDPATAALRARVSPVTDAAVPKEAARLIVHTTGGAVLDKYVARAVGSLELPMSDQALENKFRALAQWGAPECDASASVRAVWSLDRAEDTGEYLRATAPQSGRDQV
jgi:2-methylcitrate dehydratase PrpD